MRRFLFPLCSVIALTSFVQAQSPDRHPLYEPALVSAGATGDAGNLFAGAKVTASGHYGNDRPGTGRGRPGEQRRQILGM